MQKYQFYPSMINFENIININKIFKVNIIVYDKELKSIYGFCQDNVDYNILKIFTPSDQSVYNEKYINSIEPSFPNFVALSKDINYVYKVAISNTAKIGIDVINYRGIYKDFVHRFGVKAFRQTIIEEERICFDYKPFKNKMINIVSEMAVLPDTNVYNDINNINVFKTALDSPSDNGIIPVRYNRSVYFICSNFINCKKGEKLDLIVKTNTVNNTNILDFKIYKKEGILDVIYRQFIV